MTKMDLKFKMNTLPKEILSGEIFSYLSIEEILYFGFTCKKYKNWSYQYLKQLGKDTLHFRKHKERKQFFSRLRLTKDISEIYSKIFYKLEISVQIIHIYNNKINNTQINYLEKDYNCFMYIFEHEMKKILEPLFGKMIIQPSVFKFFMDHEPNGFKNKNYSMIINKYFPNLKFFILCFLRKHFENDEFNNIDKLLDDYVNELNHDLFRLIIH